jgi:hypothetical protein
LSDILFPKYSLLINFKISVPLRSQRTIALICRPSAINSSGAIAGYFQDSADTLHGFLRYHYDFRRPNAISGSLLHSTQPTAINASGTIAGYFTDDSEIYKSSSALPTASSRVFPVLSNNGCAHGFAGPPSAPFTFVPPVSLTEPDCV